MSRDRYDAVIVGSGPNGLAAAITLARAGRSVLVVEASDQVGGGLRSQALTLPGFLHDVCSAIYPMAMSSPFMRSLPLEEFGVRWIYPDVDIAHPLDDGTAVLLQRSLEATVDGMGVDGPVYQRLFKPLRDHWDALMAEVLGPLRFPRSPLLLARFGMEALLPARTLIEMSFKTERARAAVAGLAAHSILPLERIGSAAFALLMTAAVHAVGYPMVEGGSQNLANGMAAYLKTLDGEITLGEPIHSMAQLPPFKAVLFDLSPRQLLDIAGNRLTGGYRRALERYRYGPGAFKLDYALSGPIPWKARDAMRAATVHLGGSLDEIAASERAAASGRLSECPFVLVVQQTLFDPSRAPQGGHTAWVYCHVPNGSEADMTGPIEAQLERFAPGFRDCVLDKHTRTAAGFERYNPNYVGGDINVGVQDLLQQYTRPAVRFSPYTTPDPQIYLCSSATPPGGGVHGMCGYHAAQAALQRILK